MMSSRHKLLWTVIASYVIALVVAAGCLLIVTAGYEVAVENAEDLQLDGILNRQIDDLAWHRYAENVSDLARNLSQEPRIRSLVESGDSGSLEAALPQTWHRGAVTLRDVELIGVTVLRADGTVMARQGSLSPAPADFDIQAIVSQRDGIDRLKILTQVWISQGQPVLTVIHPIGGLHPVGYIALHTNPLRALSTLDQQMGMVVTFQSVDHEKQLASLENWKNGKNAQLSTAAITILGPDKTPVMVANVARDVSARLSTMRDIRLWSFTGLIGILTAIALGTTALALMLTRRIAFEEANERCKIAMNNMSQGLCMFDAEQRVVVCNERYPAMYGLTPEMTKPGTTLRDIVGHRIANGIYHAGNKPENYLSERVAPITQGSTQVHELTDGRVISITRKPMPGGGWVTTHDDITQIRQIENRIVHMAHHDALTDLPNRTLLSERLEQALGGAGQSHHRWAVHILDLDRFKEVNDTLGHPVGDALLKKVAERLSGCVKESDTVARLGGDEFAILQSLSDKTVGAEDLAKSILELLSQPFDLEGHPVTVGTSIGIALAPQDGTAPDQLLKKADLALYRAKSVGRGTFQIFEPALDERMQARYNLERALRDALVNNELELYYQPLINLEYDEICGFEALLRWNKPEGQMAPLDFIPLAEETGLIVPIGEWVLRQACTEAKTWPGHIKIAVNVSPAQFKSRGFVQTVLRALAASGLPAHRLELEVTESLVLEDSNGAFTTLKQLHDLGVRISLDDFGTGYSSLTNLRKFPFDKIKIDRSFVMDLTAVNGDAQAIVRAVATLGASLGMATTAEGVETKEQLDQVRAEGCTEMQGYYVSPPRPAHEIARLIHTMADKAANVA
jgi:diguanylate cyclase (GGDEF)-like protein